VRAVKGGQQHAAGDMGRERVIFRLDAAAMGTVPHNTHRVEATAAA